MTRLKPSLKGPLLKIERAETHLETLNTKVNEFLEGNPYRTIEEIDPNTGDHVLRGEILRPPPAKFGPIIGDAVHNLRSALDHLAYQLALVRFDTPGKVRFPVFKDAGPGDNCFDPWGMRQIKRLPDKAKVLIEEMQPYHRGQGWLWTLHLMWVTDKHKLVPLVASHGEGSIAGNISPGDFLRQYLDLFTWNSGVFKSGDEILRFPGHLAHLKEQIDPQLAFDVAIEMEGPANGQPVRELLRNLHDYVRYGSFRKFEQFFD